MNKLYVSSLIISTTIILSFSTNPPDGNTGAPGDNLCTQCHVQSNPSQNGTISLEGFPASIVPNQVYTLTAINRLTEGNAVRAGFQVTVLDQTNARAGDFMNPSSSSAVTIEGGRQYWDHSPAVLYPDSNVVKWTVQWKAPDLPDGSRITWYAAGNIANGDFSNTGDRIVTASASGTITLTSIVDIAEKQPMVYPNPGSDHINIVLENEAEVDGHIHYFDLSGQGVAVGRIANGHSPVPAIPAGVYILELRIGERTHRVVWTKM